MRSPWQRPDVADAHARAALESVGDDSLLPHRLLRDTLAWTLDNVDLPSPVKLLDYGCGAGHYSELVDRYFPGLFVYAGSDLPAMVERARVLWPGREFFVDDATRPTAEFSRFDVVCASGIVEVVKDWRRVLETLLVCPAPVVLLHRQRLASQSFTVRERAYGRRTWCAHIAPWDLERWAKAHGRTVAKRVGYPLEVHHSFVLPRGKG